MATSRDLAFSWSPQVLSSKNGMGDTPLHIAVRHNDVELTRLLVAKGANWNEVNKEGISPADIARSMLLNDITRIFNEGRASFLTWCMTNPHEADSMGYTKLMKAAYRSDEQAVRYLVEQRVAVNAVASDGHSALSIAVRAGHASIVAILLDGGADSSFRDHGMTLLDVAKSFGYADIERILKEKHQRSTYSRATAPAAGMSVTIPTSVPAGTGTVRRLRMVGTSRSQLLVDTFAGGATNNAKADTSLIDQMASLDDFVIFGNSAEQQKASAAAITDEEVNRLLQTIPDRPSESRGHKEKSMSSRPSLEYGESPLGHQTPSSPSTPRSPSMANDLDQVLQPISLHLENYCQKLNEVKNTTLDARILMLIDEIIQLFTAATNKFNGQFVDITAQAIHRAGEIIAQLRDYIKKDEDKASPRSPAKQPHSSRDLLVSLIKQADMQTKELAKNTKVAAGVWPPPEAAKDMVVAAFDLFVCCSELVAAGNSTGAFDESDGKEDESDGRMISFREYQRATNLKIIGQIAQVDKSGPSVHAVEDDGIGAATMAFLAKLEEHTKEFVQPMSMLKAAFDAGQKEQYPPCVERVNAAAVTIVNEIEEKMGVLKTKFETTDIWRANDSVRQFVLRSARGNSALRDQLELATKVTQGVWPPPDAAANMMTAAKNLVGAIKTVVSTMKELVIQFREVSESTRMMELQQQAEWEKKLLQNKKMGQLDALVQLQHIDIAELEMDGEVELTQEEDKLLADPQENVDLVLIKSTGDVDIVKGGSVEQLVVRLTYFRYPDPHFRKAFLLTYHSFTSPNELLRLLIARFDIMPPPGLNEAKFVIYFEKKIKPTRMRVFNVLKAWLVDHFEDWAGNDKLIQEFKAFLETRMRVNMPSAYESLTKSLMDNFKGLQQKLLIRPTNLGAERPILPKGCKTLAQLQKFLANEQQKNWLLIDPVEMARQMSLIEFSMYSMIQSSECLGQGWNGKEKHIRSPNITNIIDHTNKLSSWVATKILESPDVRERVRVLRYFVEVAARCREINNFNTATSLVAAFESSPVHRLKKTWEMFHDKRDKRDKQIVVWYEALLQLTNAKGNYAHYRRELHTCKPPVTPFLGVYLTDLTFIEDGNPKFLPNTTMVNFDKCQKISKSIGEIRMYQDSRYNYVELVPLQDFVCSVRGLDERLLYKRSLELEPREESNA